MKSNLEDIYVELEGLSALASVLCARFLENDGLPTTPVTGKAIYALSCYAQRLADEIFAISEVEEMEAANNKKADAPAVQTKGTR